MAKEGIMPTDYPSLAPLSLESIDMGPRTKTERRAENRLDLIRWADLEPGDRFIWNGKECTVVTNVGSSGHFFIKENPSDDSRTFERSDKKLSDSACTVISLHEHAEAEAKENKVDFDSVILAQHKKQQIIDTIRQVDNYDLIFKTWGFSSIFEKGTAISMLFFGPPGTGKTLMGQAVADKYGYELKIISTAEIETPEPGGAERNIQKAFREAGEKTVLLFDECDSLISSRKHMGSILAAQVNALLTELEHYKGIVIFTTNRIETLDEAFDRRLSLKLEFDMPDQEHRKMIWKRMFPEKAPLATDIDWDVISSIEIAGGHIKNIVLKAARMAANLDGPDGEKQITREILLTALKQEVESVIAFTEAKEYEPLYGHGLSNPQAVRVPGKING